MRAGAKTLSLAGGAGTGHLRHSRLKMLSLLLTKQQMRVQTRLCQITQSLLAKSLSFRVARFVLGKRIFRKDVFDRLLIKRMIRNVGAEAWGLTFVFFVLDPQLLLQGFDFLTGLLASDLAGLERLDDLSFDLPEQEFRLVSHVCRRLRVMS